VRRRLDGALCEEAIFLQVEALQQQQRDLQQQTVELEKENQLKRIDDKQRVREAMAEVCLDCINKIPAIGRRASYQFKERIFILLYITSLIYGCWYACLRR
jgi:hypothetical protein